MDKKELKQLMKEAAREVFQEEIKEILLEAVRSSKPVLTENQQYNPVYYNSGTKISPSPISTSESKTNLREQYMKIIGETAESTFNASSTSTPFVPHASTDSINGELPQGDISMEQIMQLTGKKY